MKSDKAHLIAFIGVMSALIFVMFLLEFAVLSGLGMTACILSLPMAIALSVYDDWKKSFLGGTILGCCSCISCLVGGSAYIMYANPLISILPCTFIGITAYWTYHGLSRALKNCKRDFLRDKLPAAIAGIVGSVTNTVLYLTAICIWNGNFMGSFTTIYAIIISIYFPIELAACFILVPVYVAVMRKITKKAADNGQMNIASDVGREELNDNLS